MPSDQQINFCVWESTVLEPASLAGCCLIYWHNWFTVMVGGLRTQQHKVLWQLACKLTEIGDSWIQINYRRSSLLTLYGLKALVSFKTLEMVSYSIFKISNHPECKSKSMELPNYWIIRWTQWKISLPIV